MALEASEAPALLPCTCAVVRGTTSVGPAVILLVLLAVVNASAEPELDISTNGLALIPEKGSLWTESMLWDKDITLRAGFGYKDNVLLTPTDARGSGFVTSGLDLSIFRLPLDGLEFTLSATGDYVYYWQDVDGANNEATFLADAQLQKYISGQWRVGLDLRYTYVDEVLEAFLISGGFRPILAKASTLAARPFVRRNLGTNWWVQLEAPQTREWWSAPLDSLWRYGGQLILGRSYGFGSQVSVSYGGFYVRHDEWLATDATGTPLPSGVKLALWQQVVDLKWEHHWDTQQLWRSITKFGFEYDADNGEGFYNFYRYQLSEELRFRTKDWEIKGTAGVAYYTFPVQTVDIPPNPKLNLEMLDLTVRVERRIYKSLRGFGTFEHEQAISNDPGSEYKVNVTSGGLSWEF